LACFKTGAEREPSAAAFSDNLCANARRVEFDCAAEIDGVLTELIYEKLTAAEAVQSKLKKVRLFLTSSLGGLEGDVEELGAFIGGLNDRYVSRGIYFQLDVSGEDEFSADGSELFYIIFHDEPQHRAREEFETAYKAFKAKKTPKIYTYYKQLDGTADGSALAFMDRLRNELGHFNSQYTNMDTIKLNLTLQLNALGLEHVKVQVEDECVTVDGTPMLTLENIPMMFNNKNLSELKTKHAEAESEFWTLSMHVHKNPGDKEAKKRFMQLSKEIGDAEEAMHDCARASLKWRRISLKKPIRATSRPVWFRRVSGLKKVTWTARSNCLTLTAWFGRTSARRSFSRKRKRQS
jgi:hypothetical protein